MKTQNISSKVLSNKYYVLYRPLGSINDKSSSTVSQDLEDAGAVIPEWKYPLSDDEAEDHRGNIDHSATSDNFGMDI